MNIEFTRQGQKKEDRDKKDGSADIAIFRAAVKMAASSIDSPLTGVLCDFYECLLDAGCPPSVILNAMRLFNERIESDN